MPTRLRTLLRRKKNRGSGGGTAARSQSLSDLDSVSISFSRSPSLISSGTTVMTLTDEHMLERMCKRELTREVKVIAGQIGIGREDLEERWRQYYVLCQGKTEKVGYTVKPCKS